MTIHVYLFLTGVLAGGVGALLGVGGGFIAVPIMFMLLGLSPQVAVGVSLTMAFFNCCPVRWPFGVKRGLTSIGWKFALATIPGAIFGSHLARSFTDRSFGIVFGLLLLALALLMYRNSMTLSRNRQKRTRTRASMFNSGWVTRDFVDAQGSRYCYSFNEYWDWRQFGSRFYLECPAESARDNPYAVYGNGIKVSAAHRCEQRPCSFFLVLADWGRYAFYLRPFQWPMAISLAAGGVLGSSVRRRCLRRLTGLFSKAFCCGYGFSRLAFSLRLTIKHRWWLLMMKNIS